MSSLNSNYSVIPYYPELTSIIGSVRATILFSELVNHWTSNKSAPFFKYKEPCQSRYYQAGESWVEILGFTRHEFDSALKILVDLGVVSTRIDIERKTWYSLNNEKVVAIFGGEIEILGELK
jgi:hypothetical protein